MAVRYSQDPQHISVEDGVGTVGITKYAQEKLVEVTVLELPHIGAQVQKGGPVGVGVVARQGRKRPYSPVSGEILAVNGALTNKPELVDEDAEGAGSIYKIKLTELSELDTLFDREAYLAYVRKTGSAPAGMGGHKAFYWRSMKGWSGNCTRLNWISSWTRCALGRWRLG